MDLNLPRWIAPVRFRFPRLPIAVEFTREGLIFVLLSLAIGAAAVNTGNNVLYLIFSLMLSLIIVSGLISRRMLMGVSATVEFPDHIFANAPNVCYVALQNRKTRIPSVGIRFLIRDKEFPLITRYFFMIPAGARTTAYAPFEFKNRGVFRLDELEVRTRFPFSFFLKIRRFFPGTEVRVYPRIVRLSEEAMLRYAQGTTIESPYRGESDQLLHIRDYHASDPSKRIHWKASARHDKLFVKEFQREQGKSLIFLFDVYADSSDESAGMFERAVVMLASFVHHFAERGFKIQVPLSGGDFKIERMEDLIPLLGHLAALEPAGPATRAPSNVTEDSVVFLLKSRTVPSRISFQSRNSETFFVEDWQHLFEEPSKTEDKKDLDEQN